MNMKSLIVMAFLLAAPAFAWNGAMHPFRMNSTGMHVMDLNSTLSRVECGMNATIALLDNQTNASLGNYSAALQKDEAAMAGYAASGDSASFWRYLKSTYLPDLKAALRALRQAVGGAIRPKMAACEPAKGMGFHGIRPHFPMHLHQRTGGS